MQVPFFAFSSSLHLLVGNISCQTLRKLLQISFIQIQIYEIHPDYTKHTTNHFDTNTDIGNPP